MNTMSKTLLALLLALCLGTAANAGPIFDDQFNSGSLNPAWTVNLQNATSWNYNNTGSALKVTDIGSATQNGDNFAVVGLSTSFGAVTDFNLGFGFAWDSNSSMNAMQYVGIELYGLANNLIARTWIMDAWVESTGAKYATIGGASYFSNYNDPDIGLSGSAVIDISRVGSNLDILFNGGKILSGVSDAQLGGIKLVFGYYDYYDSIRGSSFFGSESVDYVTLDGTPVTQIVSLKTPEDDNATRPVPEPGTLVLLGLGLIGLAGYAKKKFI